MKKDNLLINPYEEVERAYHYDDVETMYIVDDLYNAFISFYKHKRPEESRHGLWFKYRLLATIFCAGVTQGKREERARHTAKELEQAVQQA